MEKRIGLIAVFAALIAVLGLIPRIELASGVPITAQSLGIMLCGTVLGARLGTQAVLVFLILTLAGLPLLSGGRGGLALLASPSVGYLIGFPLAALVTGLIMQRLRGPVWVSAALAAFLGGFVLLNLTGILGMSVMLGVSLTEAALMAMPFALGDTLKALLAGAITQLIARARPEALISRS